MHYLSMAAANSAEVEKLALGAGMKKGGAAKGELVLAMYELANCFRNGWGIKKDPAAAKQYYETAANLGDTDAMNEVAWCYLEGFGTKKDRVSDVSLDIRLITTLNALLSFPGSIPGWLHRSKYIVYAMSDADSQLGACKASTPALTCSNH